VIGYHIAATDGDIGHVEDFLVDDATWTIRYMVVDTRNWWPGKTALVAPEWIARVDWNESKVHVSLTREQIKNRSDEAEWKARPDRPVAAPLLHVRTAELLERLRQESTWRTSGRNAITLSKEPTLRLVLMLLGKGTTMTEHQAAGPLTLHVLSGSVSFRAGDRAETVGSGELIVLESAVAHAVEALEESACLLTLGAAS
jgi:quercetin dioxygenase-like cupin family protein